MIWVLLALLLFVCVLYVGRIRRHLALQRDHERLLIRSVSLEKMSSVEAYMALEEGLDDVQSSYDNDYLQWAETEQALHEKLDNLVSNQLDLQDIIDSLQESYDIVRDDNVRLKMANGDLLDLNETFRQTLVELEAMEPQE